MLIEYKRDMEIENQKALKLIADVKRMIDHKNQKFKEIIKDIETLKEKIRSDASKTYPDTDLKILYFVK